MEYDDCDRRIKRAFQSGRRVGLWLAFNGPKAVAAKRRADIGAMRGQEQAMEGLGAVFGRAEEQAQQADVIRRDNEARMRRQRLRRPDVEQERVPLPITLYTYAKMTAPEIANALRGYNEADLRRYDREELRSIATVLMVPHRDPVTKSINATSVARRIIENVRRRL